MKTFLAVLTAGLVIFGIYLGWQHFDRWQQSRNYCVAEIDAISERSLPRAAFQTVEEGDAYLRAA